jgi:hypothetical protein
MADETVAEIEVNQRFAPPQDGELCSQRWITDVIFAQIQVSQRCALRQHPFNNL